MGRIQSNIGLITGLPIGDTVDSLMAFSAKPRELLIQRTQTLKTEQVAITELSALLFSVKYVTDNLGRDDVFDKRLVTSSAPSILTATLTGQPPKGTYQFTPLQTVQSHQLLSSGFASDTAPIGGGEFTFRFGDHVQRSADLDLFGQGAGVARGTIRITDRSGAESEIDLSAVQTVDDVLEAINSNTDIDVTAVAHGGGIRLIDNTGQVASNLIVEDVSGTTAASLGLGGINVATAVADGQDMLRLYDGIDLDELNDGSGVRRNSVLADVQFTLADGTTGEVDFSPILVGGSSTVEESTLGEMLEVINAAAPGKLQAEIAADGHRIQVTDLTSGAETFTLTAINDSGVLADLGIEGAASGGVITGRRLIGGSQSVLLSSLNGGNGLGALGQLQLTDRSGATDTVDLSAAETLEDVIDVINAAGVDVVASVNRARNGIELTDVSGSTSSNLVVASGDGTAEALGLAVDDAVSSVNGGDLHLQIIAHNTRLDDLNGGRGIAKGTFEIVESTGLKHTIDLRRNDVETIGDLIREINSAGVAVTAEINATGDGILLKDTGNGSGTLTVNEGTSTAAADLQLLGSVSTVDDGGQITQSIDGSTTFTIELDDGNVNITADTTLASLNGGDGVALGSVYIFDSNDQSAELDLSDGSVTTVGQLIDAINGLSANVSAEINDTNDGIRLIDLAGGEGNLRVLEGGSTTAADLHLLGEVVEEEIDGGTRQVVEGSFTSGIRSLEDLRQAINDLGVGVTASTFYDGSNKPYRLSLASNQAGTAGALVIDTSGVDLSLEETSRPRDAMLIFGDPDNPAANVLVTSSSNTFKSVLSGVTLEMRQASKSPVTVTVSTTDSDVIGGVQTFVDNYNTFREKLLALTKYDEQTETRAVLNGDAAALRLDADLSRLLSGRFQAAGPIGSLAEIGITLDDKGMLDLDSNKLKTRFAEDPQAVSEFFTNETFGVSARFDKLLEQLAGEENSLLSRRIEALTDKIEDNEARIAFMNQRLEKERERLLLQFYRMEMAIGKMQAHLSAISSIQQIAPLSSVSAG